MTTVREQTLRELVDAGSVRDLRAVQSATGDWALVAKIGMTERALRSQREDVRTWRKLDTVYRYARETLGINRLEIVGQ
ncbi:hypothetical protein [Arhodomonas sp. SL1]|uniref:hypothetical protein n=1 Tax=Arhodomonas sp. SL1 TaxID=3425691 RepID=UPI003F884EF9